MWNSPFFAIWASPAALGVREEPCGVATLLQSATCPRVGKQGGQRKGEKKRTQKESYCSLLKMLCCILGSKCKYHQELGMKAPDSAASTLTPVALKGQSHSAGTQSPHTLTHPSCQAEHTHSTKQPVTPDPSTTTIYSLQQLWQCIAAPSMTSGTKNPKQTTNHLMHLKNSAWLEQNLLSRDS